MESKMNSTAPKDTTKTSLVKDLSLLLSLRIRRERELIQWARQTHSSLQMVFATLKTVKTTMKTIVLALLLQPRASS
jgi:hypothetical protein